MKRVVIYSLFMALSFLPAIAGRTATVSVEYIYHIPENVSPTEAREIAFQRAQIQAIADEFGTTVTQTTSVTIDTSNEETTSEFLSIGGSDLKGEWVETIGEPVYEYITDGDALAARVKAKGRIRELKDFRIPFDVKILRNGIEDSHESDNFLSGDDMFMSFNASAPGYLSIYLIDANRQAFCLLPYSQQENGLFQVKGNKKYLFFHPDYSADIEKMVVDQLTLDTSVERERNKIVVLFSPNKFYKAADSATSADVPRNLGYDDFKKWLVNLKKRDVDLSVTEKSIVICRH